MASYFTSRIDRAVQISATSVAITQNQNFVIFQAPPFPQVTMVSGHIVFAASLINSGTIGIGTNAGNGSLLSNDNLLGYYARLIDGGIFGNRTQEIRALNTTFLSIVSNTEEISDGTFIAKPNLVRINNLIVPPNFRFAIRTDRAGISASYNFTRVISSIG